MLKNLIDRCAKEPIVLCLRSAYFDGKEIYAEYPTVAYVREFHTNDIGKFGTVSCCSVFLLPSSSEKPTIPGIIKYNGEEYFIDGVKVLKDLRGNLIGYSVAVGSGANKWRNKDLKPVF